MSTPTPTPDAAATLRQYVVRVDALPHAWQVAGTLLAGGAVAAVAYGLSEKGWAEIAATLLTAWSMQFARLVVSGRPPRPDAAFGGTRALTVIYAVVAIALTGVAQGSLPIQATLGVLLVAMVALGMGNGAVFQLVPQRFGQDVGLMTGLVGMTGGIGGFALAAALGYAKQFTDSYAPGLLLFALLALLAWGGIVAVRIRWRRDAEQFAGAHV